MVFSSCDSKTLPALTEASWPEAAFSAVCLFGDDVADTGGSVEEG